MTQTEWIISIDDDQQDYDELFVGNVRHDGDLLIRCNAAGENIEVTPSDFCSKAKRKEDMERNHTKICPSAQCACARRMGLQEEEHGEQ